MKMSSECKQVDLLCRDPESNVVTIEIAHSPDHEVHNALHCLSFSEVRKHVVIATSKNVLEALRKKFDSVPELSGNSRIELLTVAKALSAKWIP